MNKAEVLNNLTISNLRNALQKTAKTHRKKTSFGMQKAMYCKPQ